LPSAVNSNEDDALRGVSTALAVMSSMADLRDRYNVLMPALLLRSCAIFYDCHAILLSFAYWYSHPLYAHIVFVPRLRSRKFCAGRRLSWLPIENGAILSEQVPRRHIQIGGEGCGYVGANFQDYSFLIDKTSTEATLEDAHAELLETHCNFLSTIFCDQSVQLDEREKMLALAERVASSVWSVQENLNPLLSSRCQYTSWL